MPFSKKRKASNIAFKKKHNQKKRKQSSDKETTPSIKQKPPPVVHNDAKDGDTGLPFVSPFQTRRNKSKSSSNSSSSSTASVDELLEVFLQLEQLDDKLLCPAVVHGRKKLEALVQNGTGAVQSQVVQKKTIVHA